VIPDLGVNATVTKGKVTTIEVTPEEAGTFMGKAATSVDPAMGRWFSLSR
jgi:plastocyanin domain-containing protein